RRRKHVIKQSAHTKIEFLSKVKPEGFIVEGCGGEVEENDLTFDGKGGVGGVGLLGRQVCFSEQRIDGGTLLPRPAASQPSDDSHRARKCVESFPVGVAHRHHPILVSRFGSPARTNKSWAHCNKFLATSCLYRPLWRRLPDSKTMADLSV